MRFNQYAVSIPTLLILSVLPALAQQLKYKAPGIVHLRSSGPVPAQHVACLKFMDDAIDDLTSEITQFKQPMIKHRHPESERQYKIVEDGRKKYVKQLSDVRNIIVKVDWGVPPKESAKDQIAQMTAAMADNIERGRVGREVLARNIRLKESQTRQDFDKITIRMYSIWENHFKRTVKYWECVEKNGLPATISE